MGKRRTQDLAGQPESLYYFYLTYKISDFVETDFSHLSRMLRAYVAVSVAEPNRRNLRYLMLKPIFHVKI